MYRVMIYKTPYTPKPRIKEIIDKMSLKNSFSEDSTERSIRRTRRTLHDYVRCNDFDLFVTFTFSPKKVDRYDIGSTYAKMNNWLWNQRRKSPDFKYLVVPEKHKDGAIHFHALMTLVPFTLKKSTVIQDGRRVYNIPMFRYGFTNATKLPPEEKDKVGNYIAKYITKDMVVIHNRRRYWASRNLIKPTTHYNSIYELGIADKLDYKSTVMETDYNVVHEVLKNLDE